MERVFRLVALTTTCASLLLGCSMYEFKDPTGAQMRIIYSAPDRTAERIEPQTAKTPAAGAVVAAPTPAPPDTPRPSKPPDEQPLIQQLPQPAYRTANTFAILVGISSYRDAKFSGVRYAKASATEFSEILKSTVGLPMENVVVLTDQEASLDSLETYLDDWLRIRAKKESTVLVYFSGRTLVDPKKNNEAYLVPYDGTSGSSIGLLPVTKIYSNLARLPVRQVIVLLDTCFSDGDCQQGQTTQHTVPRFASESAVLWADKVVLITASSWNQPSLEYDTAQHSLFAYYVMRAFRGEADMNKDGSLGLEEFFEYVRSKVASTAAKELAKEQTPLMLPQQAIGRGFTLLTGRD